MPRTRSADGKECWIDDDTYFESLEDHHGCLANIALHLMDHHNWDLLFTETHASDYTSHFFLRLADPVSGAEPEITERCYKGVVRTFQFIDRWVGRLMTRMDDDTVFVILSDHGGTPDRYRRVSAEEVLTEAGLLMYEDDTAAGKTIDWSRTKAAPLGICDIFINLQGRDSTGIVSPEDFATIQQEVIDALMEYREPKNGYHLSTSRLGIGCQHAVFIMAGPGVKRGRHLKGQVRQVDVAPTLSYLLGIDVPRDAEGGVIHEALSDPNWHLSEIRRLSDQRDLGTA